MPTALEDAWDDPHDAKPAGWYVGQPLCDEGRKVWEQHAFDPSERARAGTSSREWTAVAATEREVAVPQGRGLRGHADHDIGAKGPPEIR